MRAHNRFCYHDCLEDTRLLMKEEYELYQILNYLKIKEDKFKEKVRRRLNVVQRDLFHIRIGHDEV